jgi:hypothetical protein
MDVKTKLILFAFDMIVPLCLGYACRYQKVLKDNFFNKMIYNNIFVVCPTVSFLSFWILPLSMELFWIPVISLFMMFVPGVFAYLWAKKRYASDLERGSFVMAAMLSNLGTIGGISVFLLYGERGYGYQQIVILMQYVFMFMFCYPIAQLFYERAHGKKAGRISWRDVLFDKKQIAVVGIFLGAALQMAGVERPESFGSISAVLVHLAAWTGLMPVGYSIDFGEVRRYWAKMLELSVIKFVLTPLLVYVLSAILIEDEVIRHSLVILSCMPSAINAVVVARIYRLNVNIGVASFFVTTFIFMAAVYPALFMMFKP